MHGFIAVDKPSGPSSTRITTQVRRSFSHRTTAGHAGTLDPLASGVLVIGIGAATRFIGYLPATKRYLVTLRLGSRTTTGDSEGEVVAEAAVPDGYLRAIEESLPGFVGEISQRAPSYSALKHKGRPLYEYARKGQIVPAKIRTVRIDSVEISDDDGDGVLQLSVVCGPGVYMRSLVEDLGQAVGCGAVMTGLVRSYCCGFALDDCVRIPADGIDPEALKSHLHPTHEALTDLPSIVLDAGDAAAIKHGKRIGHAGADAAVRLFEHAGDFIGVGEIAGGCLRSLRLLPTQTVGESLVHA